ncbi:unnamed protein product [Microthlaspi erraticum]|uniref:Uncharacterized protein n=1 Tax=Microthlaspi erraticum TaxID=1685480 RepID=A0A6D2JC74_9BRAS|nr:unnamed protein product [Microthlaspi erraticum]
MEFWTSVFAPSIVALFAFLLPCLYDNVVGCKLGENIELLNTALGELRAKRDDVVFQLDAGKVKGEQRQATVVEWLSKVKLIETDTNRLLGVAASSQDPCALRADVSSNDASPDERMSTSGCWCTDNISPCCRVHKVIKKLNEVRDLCSRGERFDAVTVQAPPPVVIQKFCDKTFGLDTTLEKTWKSLMTDRNRLLGIYGMGGVGKTTLLALINNKFANPEVKGKFDIVIWVKVSKVVDIAKIQDDIGKRLGINDDTWCLNSEEEKAFEISRVLSSIKPRFVLLLDNLWDEVSLSDIGIPLTGTEFRVVFTTRDRDVCGRMKKTEEIEVKVLEEADAWELFKLQAQCSMVNREISQVARQIAVTCGGLPLALVVTGKTMACKTTEDEWVRALEDLESSPGELRGTERGIFHVLKLSFDHLDETAKKCFQYCALFPKAHNINRDELVEYWIGEKFITEDRERQRTKNRGYNIIDALVQASLLLKDGESEQKLSMHDMIRDIVLRVRSKPEEGEIFVVQAGAELSELSHVPDWTSATKMSLMNNTIKDIPDDHEFPDQARLVTLFLQNNKLVEISGKFFVAMSYLVVLDLSRNPYLTELPEEISELVSLRYLSLLGTMIKDFPEGFGKLTRLIHLDLESTYNLQSTSLRMISRLSSFLKKRIGREDRGSMSPRT